MNARDNTPLRTLIAAHLDTAGECSALAIAKAVGRAGTPSIVVRELNAMRTDGQVECEMRKKELIYWLALPVGQVIESPSEAPDVPEAPAAPEVPASGLPPGVREGTRQAQVYRALPEHGAAPMSAREIATATGIANGLVMPLLSTMSKAGQLARASIIDNRGVSMYGYTRLPPAGSDSEGGEADVVAAKDIPPPQYDPNDAAFTAAAQVIDRHDDELVEQAKTIIDLRAELAGQSALVDDLRRENARLQGENIALKTLNESMPGFGAAFEAQRTAAAGYLVRATKRRPRTLQAEDKAREAALGAIRAGAPSAEVFALVPIGQARRSAEWRPA